MGQIGLIGKSGNWYLIDYLGDWITAFLPGQHIQVYIVKLATPRLASCVDCGTLCDRSLQEQEIREGLYWYESLQNLTIDLAVR